MNRVVVLLKDEELAEVKNRAGLIPLSAWFRDLALGGEPRKAVIITATADAANAADNEHKRGSLKEPVSGTQQNASPEMATPPKPSKKRGKHFTDTW